MMEIHEQAVGSCVLVIAITMGNITNIHIIAIPMNLVVSETQYQAPITHTMLLGSFRLFTVQPGSQRSFFLHGNCVTTNSELACVGRISHHGASTSEKP